MHVGRAVSRYLDGLLYARTALREPRVLLPFAIFAILQITVLFALAAFTLPLLSPLMVPIARALGGEQFLHYPTHLVELPAVYRRLYLPLVATVGFALWTLAIWYLVEAHTIGTERPRRPLRPFIPHAVMIGLVFVGASVATGEATTRLVGPTAPDMVSRAVLLLNVVLTAGAQSFLVYAPVVLRLRGSNAWTAVRVGAAYARRNFLATALPVFTVLLVHMPIDFLLAHADRLAARFQPETVLYLMFGSIALEMFTAYLLFACVTELALPPEGGLR